jgi:hypothetical protein
MTMLDHLGKDARQVLGWVGESWVDEMHVSKILGYTATVFRRIFSFPHACQAVVDTNLSTTRPQP